MNKSDTIVAFDLHSVVFTPNWKEVVRILWHWPHKWYIIGCAFKLRFVWQAFKLLFHEPTDEEFFSLFQEQCPKLLPLAIELFNSFKPFEGTVDILKELHTRGYILHIVSNVGPRRFKTLKERFPQIIDLFDAAKINNGKAHNIIKKPNPQFFMEYLRDFNPAGKRVIFIDNNKHNIEAAERFGMIGIVFKSPEQLRNALIQFNIL